MANLKLSHKRTTSLAGNDLSRTGGYSKAVAAGIRSGVPDQAAE